MLSKGSERKLYEKYDSVTVVIVNWNSGNHLAKFLDKLCEQTLAPTKTIVVDNASTDGSERVVEQCQNISLIQAGSNLGFAGGNNLAIKEIDTQYVALLNPDAFPEPTWLERLVEAAKKYPDVAAFGSRQMIHGSDDLIDGLGDVYQLSGLVWRSGHGRDLSSAESVLPFSGADSCSIVGCCAQLD